MASIAKIAREEGDEGVRQKKCEGCTMRTRVGQLLDDGGNPVLFDEKLMSAARDALESATVGGGPRAEGD
jgi:hypothetical protein